MTLSPGDDNPEIESCLEIKSVASSLHIQNLMNVTLHEHVRDLNMNSDGVIAIEKRCAT